jgi:hypothetical protein
MFSTKRKSMEHLLPAQGIPPDEQIIGGWTNNFEKQFRVYLAKKVSEDEKVSQSLRVSRCST